MNSKLHGLKIEKIEATPISIPFNTDFQIAGGGQELSNYVIIKIYTNKDIIGIGESSTLHYFSEESQASVLTVIENFLTPTLKGENPSNIVKLHMLMDKAIKGNTFAKAGIDLAAYDALGKALEVPVHAIIGGLYRDKIEVGQSIGIKETDKAVKDAKRYVNEGFRSIKIKVGSHPKSDMERVMAIYKTIKNNVPIRVDANQGYSVDIAIKLFHNLEQEIDLLLVEQPVPRWNLTGMAKICKALITPVLADESVFTPQDAYNVIRENAADIINIKLMKAGGLYQACKIAAIAEGANVPLDIGSMVETGIGTAAGAHLAAAWPHVRYPSDIKGPTLLEDDVLRTPIRIEEGYTYVPQAPGLGVELDEGKIERYKREG